MATYNLLREKNIDSVDKLNEVISKVKVDMKDTHKQIHEIDGKIATINETIKYLDRVHCNKNTWDNYIKSGKSSNFYESHRADLMIYESAASFLKRNSISPNVDPDAYREHAATLEEQRNVLYSDLQPLQKEHRELDIAKQNVDIIMKDTHEIMHIKGKERE